MLGRLKAVVTVHGAKEMQLPAADPELNFGESGSGH
jgi:hypothetical protein